ncbi:YdeI/OmpD-associated family protein [Loktanella sp. S4079]|uniref:YdeI/OmpD-associated family protein n=1 Tax=Loktanella sp. S4079 TaxID=579483 RepID=UPI0005F9D835|nr:YdeI/OmpD-associated family protein [Loktanella sp. S4079]KJZ18720.1 hypothetical protein TW80_13155 [Loktanella sp. S4079]
MITDPNVYFAKGCDRCARFDTPECAVQIWRDGLSALRDICRGIGLTETAKWGHPCYMHAGRNIAIFGAFRNDFRLSFMNASLLKDAGSELEPQGPNSQTPSMMRFDDPAQVVARAPIIRDFLAELMGYAEQGIKPPKIVREVDVPDELTDALDNDPELAEAFHALTPGRQKSYAFNLNQAKKTETRIARIAKFRDKIIAGKGALER